MRRVCALLLLFAATAAAASTSFQHRDWELACDNTGTCRAAGYHDDEGDGPPVSVLLTRKAGPGTPVTGEMQLGQYDDEPFPPGTEAAVMLTIAGKPHGRLALDAGAAPLSKAQVRALLDVLAGDDEIAFEADDGRRWVLSTRGSSAVLLKMDDAQGRVGTPGALTRRGTRAENTVPAARPMPLVLVPALPATTADDIATVNDSEYLRGALADSLGPDDECFDLLDPDAEVQPLDVVRLDADRLLVSHRCWLAAYNAGSGFWVIDDAPPWNPEPVTTSGTDFADGTIRAAHKGRGLGDCWSHEAWSWDGQRFIRTADESTGMCRLVVPGGTWSLPTQVTEVRRRERDR